MSGLITAVLMSAMSATAWSAETHEVFLETAAAEQVTIARLEIDAEGAYKVFMNDDAFEDHFLSMRPFKCLEGTEKHWCHVPYPYEIKRNISVDLTDLEYDFLFVWKGSTDYGINLWNGVYYKMAKQAHQIVGTLHEVDMDVLGVPPAPGDLRPLTTKDLHEGDADSHWLPRLIIK